MPPEIKNMNDLVGYLSVLEQRIHALEQENGQLKSALVSQADHEGNAIARYIHRILPNTNLLSPNFLKRSFAVWGHFFVANLIIGIIIGIGYVCLMLLLFRSLLGNLPTQ